MPNSMFTFDDIKISKLWRKNVEVTNNVFRFVSHHFRDRSPEFKGQPDELAAGLLRQVRMLLRRLPVVLKPQSRQRVSKVWLEQL